MPVLGTLNQGSSLFRNDGKQCMSNSVAAFIHHEPKPASTWDSSDIDTILINGDNLHTKLFEHSSVVYPKMSDFPMQCKISGYEVDMHNGDSYFGLMDSTEDSPPYFCLETSLSMISKFALLIIGSKTPAYASAIIKDENKFYIFDPHSRGVDGMAYSEGAAVLTTHRSVKEVKEFLLSLASSIGHSPCPFELTLVSVAISTLEPVYHSLKPAGPSNWDESSDSDVPLARIRKSFKTHKVASGSDTDKDSDNMLPLMELKRQIQKVRRQKEANQSIANDDSSSDNLENSDIDPDYDPSVDDVNWTSPKHIPRKRQRMESEPEENMPLKYLQVSVDAMRVITQDPDQSECAHQEPFLPACSDMERDNSEIIPTSAVPTSTQVSVLECSASPTPDTSIQTSPEPLSMQRGRKRRRNESSWKDVQRKKSLNLGESYTSRKGRVIERKKLKAGCGPKCRMHCQQRIKKEQRETMFHLFWKTGSIDMRRLYVCHNVQVKDKATAKVDPSVSKRKRSLNYNMELDGAKVPVCKTFFLDTLGISDQFVFTAISKKDEGGHCAPDMRGRHAKQTPARKEEKERVRAHIASFPTVESHYCRKDSERRYLGASLNLATMYRLYREQRLQEKAQTMYSSTRYCEIFRTEFNLGFHNPSKDRCDFCVSYENFSEQEKSLKQNEYDFHQRNKQRCHDKKSKDKEVSRKNLKKMSICFDLQEVLMTPHSNASVLFYKRKLNTFNLSIFDLGTGQAVCNVWHEGVSARGSNQIASCVYECLKSASDRGVEDISMYSDSCGGQNRNKYFLSMLWYALNKFGFQEIEHNFFIKGHSKNENDSVHATIERVSKNVDIYTTPQWASIMSTAKQTKPRYIVRELDETCFFDFKLIAAHLKNFDLDTDRQKVQWLNIKSMKLRKDQPNTVQIWYDYDGHNHTLNLAQRIRKVQSLDFDEVKLSILNNGIGPGIDEDKYNDLQSLCQSQIIPRIHHQFFSQLKKKSK